MTLILQASCHYKLEIIFSLGLFSVLINGVTTGEQLGKRSAQGGTFKGGQQNKLLGATNGTF